MLLITVRAEENLSSLGGIFFIVYDPNGKCIYFKTDYQLKAIQYPTWSLDGTRFSYIWMKLDLYCFAFTFGRTIILSDFHIIVSPGASMTAVILPVRAKNQLLLLGYFQG